MIGNGFKRLLSISLDAGLIAAVFLSAETVGAQTAGGSLRFFGNGVGDIDRVKIRIDAPEVPADIGAGDFTLEFWMKAAPGENTASGCAAGEIGWITGNIIFDRDIYGNGDYGDFGLSLFESGLSFGVGRSSSGAGLCGSADVADGGWHHVAVTRRASDGTMRLYVDGRLDGSAIGPTGDLSYRNGRPGAPNDPFLVIGAEKHDAGSAYPSFSGWIDEVRLSTFVRYGASFAAPTSPFVADAATVALYHFDEGAGNVLRDSSGALGGPSDGNVRVGGSPTGPLWSTDAPFGPAAGRFRTSMVVSGLDEPTVMEFASDGRLFIGERAGRIRVVEGGTLLAQPLVQFSTDAGNEERGFFGMTLDPSFDSNGFIYVFYTTREPRNRVERYRADGNTADPASAFTVWENADRAAAYHHGGGLAFGPDGNLYIATGDQGDPTLSRDLSTQHGKILRIRPDGSVPADNPFLGVAGAERPVWARGLRNPFRIVFDGPTLWIGDVGGNNSDSYEEVNRGIAGADYGWPLQEGPRCFTGECGPFTFPVYSYRHNDPRYFITQPQASITLGPVYRATSFPLELRGSLFVGDFANRWIRRLNFGPTGEVAGDPVFAGPPDGGTVVDLKVGPDGALYFLTYGKPTWISGAPDPAAVHRVSFTGGGNQPPIARSSAVPLAGPVPLAVQFRSAGSIDPDDGPESIRYRWTFGDGGASTEAEPLHTYTSPGRFEARLFVSDGESEVAADPLEIVAGNPPIAEILEPPEGTSYRAGDSISFAGRASDAEDGTLGAAALTWRVLLRHADHAHPFLGPIAGRSNGSFTVPTTGHGPEGTRYEVELTATDSHGLTHALSRPLVPLTSIIEVRTEPAGIPIFLDGAAVSTPRSYAGLEGFRHTIEAPAVQVHGGMRHLFHCWSDGGERVHEFSAPEEGAALTARFRASEEEVVVRVPVEAMNRNADYWPDSGEEFGNAFDARATCIGRDNVGPYQSAFSFRLDVPEDALLFAVRLQVVATNDQSGSPAATIRGYDVASAAVFDRGHTHALTGHHTLTDAAIGWDFPAFSPDGRYDSPDLTPLLEEVLARPDWSPGNYFGIVIDGSTSPSGSWRCVRNFQAGAPAELRVAYTIPISGPPPDCGPPAGEGRWRRCDFNCDAQTDISDAIAGLGYLFSGGREACCAALEDCNGDSRGDLSDWVFLLRYLFGGGVPPSAPFPSCGTVDGETCASYPPCEEP